MTYSAKAREILQNEICINPNNKNHCVYCHDNSCSCSLAIERALQSAEAIGYEKGKEEAANEVARLAAAYEKQVKKWRGENGDENVAYHLEGKQRELESISSLLRTLPLPPKGK